MTMIPIHVSMIPVQLSMMMSHVNDDNNIDDVPTTNDETRPLRRHHRLGLSTRRRRQIVDNNVVASPASRHPRIDNHTNESEVEIDVGTKVKSPDSR